MDKEPIQLEIRSLSSTGEGVGLYEGLVTFVEGGLPGEIVLAKPSLRKKKYAKANLLKVLKASVDRQTPPCPLFEKCGGCQIMHLNYEAQLELKKERVEESMRRIAKIKEPNVSPCIPSPNPLSYRNKIQLPATTDKGQVAFGLYAKNSHDVIPIESCLIHGALGESALHTVQEKINEFNITPYDPIKKTGLLRHLLIKSAISTEEVLIVLITTKGKDPEIKKLAEALLKANPTIKGVIENVNGGEDNVILGKNFFTLAGSGSIQEVILGKCFNVSPASFFQVNPKQAERLYIKAIEFAKFTGAERLLDAYSGVGVLSQLASSFVKEAVGIECVMEAVQDAKENAKTNQLTNVFYHLGKTENLAHKLGFFDTVFLNPPRKGCEKSVLETLAKMKPKNIIYISCDPATLARDLLFLIENGFEVEAIQPFDMFPQTMHVETIVSLKRLL